MNLRSKKLRESAYLIALALLLTVFWVTEAAHPLLGRSYSFSNRMMIGLLAGIVLFGYHFYLGYRWSRATGEPNVVGAWFSQSRPRWLRCLTWVPFLLLPFGWLLVAWRWYFGQRPSVEADALAVLMLTNSLQLVLDLLQYRRWILSLPSPTPPHAGAPLTARL